MQADGVAGRNNSTRDDVVAVHQGASDRLADAIDVNRRSGDESDDEADGGSQQGGDHQHTEPTDIQTVVGGGDPLAEGLPARSAGALLDGGGHENGKKCPRGDGLWKGQESLPPPNVKQYCVLCSEIAPTNVQTSCYRWGAQKDLRFQKRTFILVLIRWLLAGQRLEETVPLASARHRRNQLEAEGATVYWSERLING